MAVPSGTNPAGEALNQLLPKTHRQSVAVGGGFKAREIGGDLIRALPKGSSLPAEGDDASGKKQGRLLRRGEVVVPDSLQASGSKRALYCGSSGYNLCPNRDTCYPPGGECCSSGGFCYPGEYCDVVDGFEGCCEDGLICTEPPVGNSRNDDNHPTTTTRRVAKPTTVDTTTTIAEAQQATDTTPFAFPTTTPTRAGISSKTSSSSRASSTSSTPFVAMNSALAVTFQKGYAFFLATVLLALGHMLGMSPSISPDVSW
ncbi:hypothetical protein FRC01_003750 [Tulasnella sp. 417]|nr:hypothetical protein FRC01_003750 [Tulasnella sp. 417]